MTHQDAGAFRHMRLDAGYEALGHTCILSTCAPLPFCCRGRYSARARRAAIASIRKTTYRHRKKTITTHTRERDSHICRDPTSSLDQGLGEQDSYFVRNERQRDIRVKSRWGKHFTRTLSAGPTTSDQKTAPMPDGSSRSGVVSRGVERGRC